MSDYIKKVRTVNADMRRRQIDAAVDGPEPAASAPAAAPAVGPLSGMSQADFGGKKTESTPAQRAKLAELLKKRMQEN
jgi:hypothetical protein